MRVERRSTGGDAVAFDGDAIEPAPEPDHHAPDAAVAHDEVGADTHREDRDGRVEPREEGGKVSLVRRLEKPVRRPADAQPGQIGQGPAGGERAADGRKDARHGAWVDQHAESRK